MNWITAVPFVSFLILIILISERIFILKRRGISTASGKNKYRKSSVFMYPVFIIILLIWFTELIKPVFPISFSILPKSFTQAFFELVFLKITGAGFIAAALILLAITLQHFKTSLRFGLDNNNPGKLITTGIFSVSRNPFFLSLIFYFLGIAFIFQSLFFIGFSLLAIVGIHFFILKEEKFMRKFYEKEYENYSKKVRRYF